MGCPNDWSELAPTEDSKVRTCGSCNHKVYFCETDQETIAHARAGRCIARLRPDERELPPMYLGRPTVEQLQRTPEQERADAWEQREIGIFYSLRTLGPDDCETCGYPKVKRCQVCERVE